MPEELIENYVEAKAKYEAFENNLGQMMSIMAAQSVYGDATEKLLDFIEKHSDTLISWERQHALRLSPFEDPE